MSYQHGLVQFERVKNREHVPTETLGGVVRGGETRFSKAAPRNTVVRYIVVTSDATIAASRRSTYASCSCPAGDTRHPLICPGIFRCLEGHRRRQNSRLLFR